MQGKEAVLERLVVLGAGGKRLCLNLRIKTDGTALLMLIFLVCTGLCLSNSSGLERGETDKPSIYFLHVFSICKTRRI